MDNIKIGICVDYNKLEERLPQVIAMGFESVSISGKTPLPEMGMKELAKRTFDIMGDSGVTVSSVGTYGNPLTLETDRKALETLIGSAKYFHTDIIGTYAGALSGQTVDASMPEFKKVFSELAKRAEAEGVKIAFENCLQGGTWKKVTNNIAFNEKAWEMMFSEVPSEALGLEWEPAHQMAQLVLPVAQLDRWADKIFHVHGKDAHVNHEYINQYGIHGSGYIAQFCNPGNGDTNWSSIIEVLRRHNYKGSISIEQCVDPVYHGERLDEGIEKSLQYIKNCRSC